MTSRPLPVPRCGRVRPTFPMPSKRLGGKTTKPGFVIAVCGQTFKYRIWLTFADAWAREDWSSMESNWNTSQGVRYSTSASASDSCAACQPRPSPWDRFHFEYIVSIFKMLAIHCLCVLRVCGFLVWESRVSLSISWSFLFQLCILFQEGSVHFGDSPFIFWSHSIWKHKY